MTRLEKFGLATGVIGLFADGIALATFLSGLWGSQPSHSGGDEMPAILLIILAVTIVYGWLALCWFLVRKDFLARKGKRKQDKPEYTGVAFRAVVGIGILMAPLALAWWAAVSRGDISQQAIPIQTSPAVLTPSASPSPTLFGNSTSVPPIANSRVTTSSSDTTAIGCIFPIVHVVVAVGIYLVLILLMPMLYSDMPPVDIGEILDSLMPS